MGRTAAELRAILAELKIDTDDFVERFRLVDHGGEWKRAYLPDADVVVDAYRWGSAHGWRANVYLRDGGPQELTWSMFSSCDTGMLDWRSALPHIRTCIKITLDDGERLNRRRLPDLAAKLGAAAANFDQAALRFWDMMKEHQKRKKGDL